MISIQVQEKNLIEFPSVVFCSLDAYKKVGDYVENIDLSAPPNPNVIGVLSEENQRNIFTRYLYSTMYASFNETVKEKLNNPLNETIISCFYNFELCDVRDFTLYTSVNYGPCLRYTASKPLTKPGHLSGLQLDILLDPLTVGKSIGAERGLSIAIENRASHISYSNGLSIKSGQRTNIGVSKTIFKNLPEPYSSCVPAGAQYPSELYQYIVESSNYTYTKL